MSEIDDILKAMLSDNKNENAPQKKQAVRKTRKNSRPIPTAMIFSAE